MVRRKRRLLRRSMHWSGRLAPRLSRPQRPPHRQRLTLALICPPRLKRPQSSCGNCAGFRVSPSPKREHTSRRAPYKSKAYRFHLTGYVTDVHPSRADTPQRPKSGTPNPPARAPKQARRENPQTFPHRQRKRSLPTSVGRQRLVR